MTLPCQLQFVDYLAQSQESVILFHGHITLTWEQGDHLVSKSLVIFMQSSSSSSSRKCQDPKRPPYRRKQEAWALTRISVQGTFEKQVLTMSKWTVSEVFKVINWPPHEERRKLLPVTYQIVSLNLFLAFPCHHKMNSSLPTILIPKTYKFTIRTIFKWARAMEWEWFFTPLKDCAYFQLCFSESC